jgi:hypothetical protein
MAGLKFNLNEDGKFMSELHGTNLVSFCRDESWNNDWRRQHQLQTDIGNRRFLAYAQVSKDT